MKDPIQVSERLYSGDQPSEDDLRRLADAGFRSIINLRKPGEANQPISPENEQVFAEAHGLNYASLPVSVAELNSDLFEQLNNTIDELPAPIFVHCAVGQRAAALAFLCEVAGPGVSSDDVLREAEAKGIRFADRTLLGYVREMAEEIGGVRSNGSGAPVGEHSGAR